MVSQGWCAVPQPPRRNAGAAPGTRSQAPPPARLTHSTNRILQGRRRDARDERARFPGKTHPQPRTTRTRLAPSDGGGERVFGHISPKDKLPPALAPNSCLRLHVHSTPPPPCAFCRTPAHPSPLATIFDRAVPQGRIARAGCGQGRPRDWRSVGRHQRHQPRAQDLRPGAPRATLRLATAQAATIDGCFLHLPPTAPPPPSFRTPPVV